MCIVVVFLVRLEKEGAVDSDDVIRIGIRVGLCWLHLQGVFSLAQAATRSAERDDFESHSFECNLPNYETGWSW